MVDKKNRECGLSGSTHSLSSPSFDGVDKQNYTLSNFSSQYSPCTELDKAWLWSALPDDWRLLPSPLERLLSGGLVSSGASQASQDAVKFPRLVMLGSGPGAQDSTNVSEPGCCLLSNVAKVQEGLKFSSVPPLPPQVGLQFYSNDVRLVRAAAPARGGGPRQKCTEISKSSLKNAKFTIANSSPDLHSLICCTYPATFPADGRIVKAHHKSLLQRIRARFGPISYFTAFEYQSDRQAPHFHIAISLDLKTMGEVVKLKRKGRFGRRYPAFLTVLDLNRWLFEAWLDIISSPDEVSYKKEVLDWSGLPAADIEKMKIAFYECNSSTAWEVMRSDTGAKHYMVKELSWLKAAQKIVPDFYDNPGRHFLYSRDMRPGDPIQEFVMGDFETREILEALSWAWMPKMGRPLNKTIWNVAASMIVELLERGYKPLRGASVDTQGHEHSRASLDALRRFDDSRMFEFMAGSDFYSEGTINSWFRYGSAVVEHWEQQKRKLAKQAEWDFIFANDPAAGWDYCPLLL